MKKIISIILLIVITLTSLMTFSGCKKDSKTVRIGIAIYQYTDNFMALYRDKLIDDFEEQGKKDGKNYVLTMVDSKNDPYEQSNQIDTFIAMGMDAIILNPVLTSACDTLIKKIVNADIPCILINREPLGYNEKGEVVEEGYGPILNNDRVVFVGCKAKQSGEYQGEIIYGLENHGDRNKDGKLKYIMIMGDPENPDAQYRTEYSIKRYNELAEKDNIVAEKVIDNQLGGWDQVKAEELVSNALSQHGDEIEVIFCNNDAMALGAAQAVKKKGYLGKISIVGVDGLDEVKSKVETGEITGTVINDHEGQSKMAVEQVVKLLKQKKEAHTKEFSYFWVPYKKWVKGSK